MVVLDRDYFLSDALLELEDLAREDPEEWGAIHTMVNDIGWAFITPDAFCEMVPQLRDSTYGLCSECRTSVDKVVRIGSHPRLPGLMTIDLCVSCVDKARTLAGPPQKSTKEPAVSRLELLRAEP